MERSDGVRRPGRVDAPRGDGLATVTYLPGVLPAQERPVDAPMGAAPSDRPAPQQAKSQRGEAQRAEAQRREAMAPFVEAETSGLYTGHELKIPK